MFEMFVARSFDEIQLTTEARKEFDAHLDKEFQTEIAYFKEKFFDKNDTLDSWRDTYFRILVGLTKDSPYKIKDYVLSDIRRIIDLSFNDMRKMVDKLRSCSSSPVEDGLVPRKINVELNFYFTPIINVIGATSKDLVELGTEAVRSIDADVDIESLSNKLQQTFLQFYERKVIPVLQGLGDESNLPQMMKTLQINSTGMSQGGGPMLDNVLINIGVDPSKILHQAQEEAKSIFNNQKTEMKKFVINNYLNDIPKAVMFSNMIDKTVDMLGKLSDNTLNNLFSAHKSMVWDEYKSIKDVDLARSSKVIISTDYFTRSTNPFFINLKVIFDAIFQELANIMEDETRQTFLQVTNGGEGLGSAEMYRTQSALSNTWREKIVARTDFVLDSNKNVLKSILEEHKRFMKEMVSSILTQVINSQDSSTIMDTLFKGFIDQKRIVQAAFVKYLEQELEKIFKISTILKDVGLASKRTNIQDISQYRNLMIEVTSNEVLNKLKTLSQGAIGELYLDIEDGDHFRAHGNLPESNNIVFSKSSNMTNSYVNGTPDNMGEGTTGTGRTPNIYILVPGNVHPSETGSYTKSPSPPTNIATSSSQSLPGSGLINKDSVTLSPETVPISSGSTTSQAPNAVPLIPRIIGRQIGAMLGTSTTTSTSSTQPSVSTPRSDNITTSSVNTALKPGELNKKIYTFSRPGDPFISLPSLSSTPGTPIYVPEAKFLPGSRSMITILNLPRQVLQGVNEPLTMTTPRPDQTTSTTSVPSTTTNANHLPTAAALVQHSSGSLNASAWTATVPEVYLQPVSPVYVQQNSG